MMKSIKAILFAAVAGLSANAVAGPLAPAADLDGKFSMLVKPQEREVPDSAKVGVPAYPGSLFCTVKTGKWGPGAWSEAHLLTTDSYEKVAAWYRDHLDGWYCKEWAEGVKSSCSDKDPGDAGNYDPETFNVVDVLQTGKAFPCVLPGVQTGITLRFQPD